MWRAWKFSQGFPCNDLKAFSIIVLHGPVCFGIERKKKVRNLQDFRIPKLLIHRIKFPRQNAKSMIGSSTVVI